MKNVVSFIKKRYHVISLVLVLIIIIILNIKKGFLIMGLDNISPYFNSDSIISKAFENRGLLFPSFGPMVLLLPVWDLLKAIGIPLWLIIQGYFFSMLTLGTFGAAFLSHETYKLLTKKTSRLAFVIGGCLYIANLCTAWIFNQVNYFFIASYATIPWMILIFYYLSHKAQFKFGFFKSALLVIFISLIVIIFGQTSLNLSVFILYLGQIALITSVLLYIRDRTKYMKSLLNLLLLVIAYALLWLGVLQAIILIFGSHNSIIDIYINFYKDIVGNPLTTIINRDLRASGYLRNGFLNNIMFNNTWMEAHTLSNNLLFGKYLLYTFSYFRYLLLVPFILTLLALKDEFNNKRVLIFHGLIILSLVLMSNFILKVTSGISILSEVFRWSSSKFWILLVIPIVLIASSYLVSLFKRQRAVFLGISALIIISVTPVFYGNLFSKQMTVKLPNEYFNLEKAISPAKSYYYFPIPQNTYFYQYKFGYFGSDFVGYITSGNYANKGVISYFNNYSQYKEIDHNLRSCNADSLRTLSIIYDKNIVSQDNEIYTCLTTNFKIVQKINNIEIYESK